MVVKLMQPPNARAPIAVTLTNLVQEAKADAPILTTPAGIVATIRLEQPKNAAPPIFVTLFPMVTLVRLVQLLNA
jgi:hypothetical protein